ncbi:hypothetical protein Tsubulata_008537 [Turnera subulata]|uniref:U-box domain-containing protein n=1 Tax=Turnera subulata TaxID=218843 RepID=A0A9Q0J321_9ROSI|nr:hypothetical protein Tsubulata_008537 [Turnera subulata]
MSAARLRETIAQCLSDARSSGSADVQQKALHTLASITRVSPQNRNMFAQTDGAIATLLALIQSSSSSSSSILRNLSLSILFNLSLNPDLKRSLADMETIHLLNSIIPSTTSRETSRLACSLVCSLAMLDKNKAKFGMAGTVQVLVNAISKPRGAPAAHHILSSLAELVQFHGNCTLAVRSGAIEALIEVVESTDTEGEDLTGTSLAVVGLLARFDEGLNALIRADQIVSSMVEVLKGRCMLRKEGAAEILVRLFDENEGCVRDALRLPEFSTVLADLSVRGSSRARDKAAQLMKKAMDANLDPHVEDNSTLLQWY